MAARKPRLEDESEVSGFVLDRNYSDFDVSKGYESTIPTIDTDLSNCCWTC